MFAKQKESYIHQLMKADAAKQELQKSMQQLEDQLVRATTEVQQRRQQAADKGEHLDQQLSLLRKVRRWLLADHPVAFWHQGSKHLAWLVLGQHGRC